MRFKGMVAALVAACSASSLLAAEPLKVGFVYETPIMDVGWVATHEEARKKLEHEFGSQIQTHTVSNVAVGADGEREIRQLASQGYKTIILGSFGYMNDGLKVARSYPGINFVHSSGYKNAANFATYDARAYEGAYVAGVVAGRMTKTNELGYVAATPIPDIIATINAFALGAQSVNPKIQVRTVWINEWYNPGKERDAATVLIGQGADVIYSGWQDSPSIVQTCEQKHVFVVGMFSDVTKYAPNYLLTSIRFDWFPIFKKAVTASLAGKQFGEAYWGGLSDGAISLTKWNSKVPVAVQQEANHVESEIASGSKAVFAGPITDNTGKVQAKAGSALNDDAIASMNWLVAGVQGEIPK